VEYGTRNLSTKQFLSYKSGQEGSRVGPGATGMQM
jgi:hypothetical protein